MFHACVQGGPQHLVWYFFRFPLSLTMHRVFHLTHVSILIHVVFLFLWKIFFFFRLPDIIFSNFNSFVQRWLSYYILF